MFHSKDRRIRETSRSAAGDINGGINCEIMRRWTSLCGLLAFLCSVEGTYRPYGHQQQAEAAQTSISCFCYGHTHSCSPAPGFSVHNISSTFTHGPEEWRVATATGVTPADVHFRWSPKHQDIEVISSSSLPVYLYAPGRYLSNQLLSYGQNLTFSLRLDRGVRHPSTNDVVLEGSGLRVAASLGELRSIVPCGQKITYSFRLDEQASSKWKPHLSSFQFQTLLQNLTALKIRATFGENGRGYLDNVSLISAQRGAGVLAPWVPQCVCPRAYQGQFCERCSSGYKRRAPAKGAFSPCEPCSCVGGSCDPDTGDCYSADETQPGRLSCLPGYYNDPHRSLSCVPCPCPSGTSCMLEPRALKVQCDQCPPGAIGSRCQVCQDGYYGDPEGRSGQRRPCQPCQCDSMAGGCDPSTGDCVKCQNNTRGRQCEACLDGYYHSQPGDMCKSCDCNVEGSQSNQCNDKGQCVCKTGFEGQKCQLSACPSCFDPIKTKVERFAAKLQEFENMFELGGGSMPDSSVRMEVALRAAEQLISELQENSDRLAESEKKLQARLAAVSQDQLSEGEVLQDVQDTAGELGQRQQTYAQRASEAQTLINKMKRKVEAAKLKLQAAELPLRDETLGTEDTLSTLVQTATKLAYRHQNTAGVVEKTAQQALRDSQESLALVRTLVNKENRVTELLGDLKSMYDQTSAKVKLLEGEASRLSSEAGEESNMADSLLTQIVAMEMDIPAPLKVQAKALVGRLDSLTNEVKDHISARQTLRKEVGGDISHAQILLTKGRDAQRDYDRLLARVNAAKADTESALKAISDNTNSVDEALKTLRGFDQQIELNRALAEAAITRLPGINGTIQQAVRNNGETLSFLGAVPGEYENALKTINQLETLVSGLELSSATLPSHGGLLKDSIQLSEEAEALRKQAEATSGNLGAELDGARKQRADAEQASLGANAALSKAQQTSDAVRRTLETVEDLLKAIGQPGSIDEQRLSELENLLVNAKSRVNEHLKPRLLSMEEQEAAQRSRLDSLNRDIDNILRDISNLEEIVNSIPDGCFNTPPQEIA